MEQTAKQLFHGVVRVEERNGYYYPYRLTRGQADFFAGQADCRYANASANIYLEFTTRKKEIGFSYEVYQQWHWYPDHAWWPDDTVYFGVYIGDEPVSLYPAEQKGRFHYSIETEGETVVRIALPDNAAVCVGELDFGDYAPTEQKPKRLLVIGDSITQGLIGNSGSQNFITHISAMQQMEPLNQSVGGAQFWPDMIDETLPFVPTHVLVSLGTNDVLKNSPLDAIKSRIQQVLQRVAALYPAAEITVLTPIRSFLHEDSFADAAKLVCPKSPEELRQRYVAVCREIGTLGERFGMCVVPGSDLLPLDRRYFSDEVHPNDLGFAQMAIQFIKITQSSYRR